MTLQIQLYNPVLGKLNEFIRDYENLPKTRMETATENLTRIVERENDEKLYEASQQQQQSIQTGNIQDLYELLKDALHDYTSIMNPQYTGKIRNDLLIEENIERFYNVRMKNYARDIVIIIDALIKHDGYDTHLFSDYKELERLVFESDTEHALVCFRRLIAVGKTTIPIDIKYETKIVIDSSLSSSNQIREG